MNLTLPATDLKRIVKRLSTVQSISTIIGGGIAWSSDGDMEISIQSHLLDSDKQVKIDSRLFQTTCNKLSGDVSLVLEETKLIIKSKKFKAELPTILQSNLSWPVSSQSELKYKIETKTLIRLLTFAGAVTDEKASFDYTGCVQLTATPDSYWTKFEAIGTDKFRIAVISDSAKIGTDKFKLLIPTKIIKAIKDLDEKYPTDAGTTISELPSSIVFESGDTKIYTRKLSKHLPDVFKVIPKDYKLHVEIKTEEFLEALNRIAPTIDPETDSQILLDFQGDSLKLSSGNSLIGKSQDEIPVNPLIPDALDDPMLVKIGVSARFLNAYLTLIKDCDTILFKANESGKPFFMESGSRKILMAGVRI